MKNMNRTKKIINILLLFLLPIIIFYTMEFFLRNPFEKMRVGIQFLNIAFFELVAVILFFAAKSVRIAIRVEAVVALLIGLIDYFVVQFRSNPVMPWDIYSIKTAAVVADNYDYSLEPQAIICVVILLLFFAGTWFIPKWDKLLTPLRIAGSVIGLILLILLTNYVQTPQAVKTFHLYDKLFTPNTMTYKDGTVVAFLMQCQYLKVEEPKGYSKDKAESILADIESVANEPLSSESESIEELPNIIVIMNEAFSDLSILGEYTTNMDEMPFMRSLMAGAYNTVSGYMDVPVLGGNTANTEFEFLTGDTMAFLPQGSIAYQQFVHDKMPSVASTLKALGYRTVALHPYRASGWDRSEVYPYFGFDAFYSQSDFTNPLIYRKYISDQSDVEKVIEIYEQNPEQPLFMFNVTMQNHSSYSDVFDNFTPQIEVEGTDSVALNQYLSLLYESDKALEQLVQYFDRLDDPTIIVFFGDHQPTDSVVAPIYKLNGESVYSLSEEELSLRYKVPYIIHANFDIEEEQNVPMSSNYLGIKTLELAGVTLNSYQQFVAENYRKYPSVSVLQIRDADGNVYSVDKKEELLNDYQILQYHHLFEK
ncbi:MAG: LTA synthase family protein [Lachnospiraceae bacterium]|nr:LTA synthase family protein [Lachnospiraceae bacterium]